MKTDERAFRVGADGEKSVGGRLDRLTKHGWHVLHSIPLPVVAGTSTTSSSPRAAHTLSTRALPSGKVWVGEKAVLVNGQKTHDLRNSRYEAERVHKALLAFLTITVLPQVTIKQSPPTCWCLTRRMCPERSSGLPSG